jgi:hypothetical protein
MPKIMPTIDAKFNFILKERISKLNPIGPVRLVVMILNCGINFTTRFPSADPRIPPRIIKAKKYPMFDLSKTILFLSSAYSLKTLKNVKVFFIKYCEIYNKAIQEKTQKAFSFQNFPV